LNELLKRTLSGVGFVLIMLFAIWFHEISFFILLTLIFSLGTNEFIKLICRNKKMPVIIVTTVTGILILGLNFLIAGTFISSTYLIINFLLFFATPLILLFFRPNSFSGAYVTSLTSLLYMALPLSLMVYITFMPGGYEPLLITAYFILLWTFDSFAYIFGRILGKHKILPSISPKKSWEGFAGGIIFILIVAILLHRLASLMDLLHWMIIALIVAITGTAGDFAESAIKRKSGVKDSGNLIPGHGGIMDRFDAVFMSVPFVFLYLALFVY